MIKFEDVKNHIHKKMEDLEAQQKKLLQEALACATVDEALEKATQAQALVEEANKLYKTLGYLMRVEKDISPGTTRGISLT